MKVVDKKGIVVTTKTKTISSNVFIQEVLPKFKHIRVGVSGGKPPFKYTYFKVSKKEVTQIVIMNQMRVKYSIMYNSRVDSKLEDVLYIESLRMTIFDKKKAIKKKPLSVHKKRTFKYDISYDIYEDTGSEKPSFIGMETVTVIGYNTKDAKKRFKKKYGNLQITNTQYIN